MLPALDTNGKILLKSYHEMQMAPNGNGALFAAIRSNQQVSSMLALFEYVQIIGVDNALNKVLDPIQIGYTHHHKLQTSLKAVEKTEPGERVGAIGMKNGKYNLIEYSDLPP